MNQDDYTSMYSDWYELWMKQSKEFYESADKNLKNLFENGQVPDPKAHLEQIHQWLEELKQQWEYTQLTEEQKAYASYWKMMAKMCSDANELMLQQWIKRNQENHPIKNVRELYELWLASCNEVYKKTLNSSQNPYGDFMNAAIHFWKSAMTK